MGKIFEYIAQNGERTGIVTILLFIVLGLGYVVYALSTGRVPTPTDYKRLKEANTKLESDCLRTEDTLSRVSDELADSRVLHGAAAVRIEFLELENRRKEGEVSELRARVARLEAQIEGMSAQLWQRYPDPGAKRR